jgi:hypothetical protein
MSTTIAPIKRPSSPEGQYRQLREAGIDHAEAVRKVSHSYQRPTTEIARLVRRVREEVEHPAPEAPEPEPEQAEPDRFDVVETEIRGTIADLEGRRASLALDALTDERKARELGDVEARLAGARAELERVGLARAEAERRELAEHEQAKAKAVADARRRASELQVDREAAARAVDEGAAAFATALAAHQRICAEQASVLGGDWRQVLPPQYVLEAAFAHALNEASAPVPAAELSSLTINRAAPLAALDPHVIEPAPEQAKKSTTNTKE